MLTEWPAIATFLSSLAPTPERALLPADALARARVYEATDYIVAAVHMQGFTRIVRPGNFSPVEDAHEAVKARGREIFESGLAAMDAQLRDQDYVAGDFSFADAALFYCEHWMAARLGGTLPANCRLHFDRMLARPAVARALERGA